MGFAELKHHSRHDCDIQRRDSYVPSPFDGTQCYHNERTCHQHYDVTGLGSHVNVTYDWKHLIYEDYDRWLYNKYGAGQCAC
jgi:hypothetical protein